MALVQVQWWRLQCHLIFPRSAHLYYVRRIAEMQLRIDADVAAKDAVIYMKDMRIAELEAAVAELTPVAVDEFEHMNIVELRKFIAKKQLPLRSGKDTVETRSFVRKAKAAKEEFDTVVAGSEDDILKQDIITQVEEMSEKEMRLEVIDKNFPMLARIKYGDGIRQLPVWLYYWAKHHGDE
jgi:hypothetical protein